MYNPVGTNSHRNNFDHSHLLKQTQGEKRNETRVDVICRLFPEMNDFPLTEELAEKFMTWFCVPHVLKPIFKASVLNKTAVKHRDDQVHVDQFKKIINNLYVILEPAERALPTEQLVQKLYEKYREIYTNEANVELQELLDKALGSFSHGSLALQIYKSAVPILKQEVEDWMDIGRSLYSKIHIREFLNERNQNNASIL